MLKKVILFISIFLMITSAIVAALCHRPLLGETSTWYLSILTNAETYFDTTFYRHTDRLLQLPVVVLLNLLGSGFLTSAIYLQHFLYSLPPFLSLYACYVILKKAKRFDLIVFPILSCATVVFSGYQQVMLMSINAVSLFWPLFFLILLGQVKSIFQKLSLLILLVLLIFTYEPALLFLVFILVLIIFSKVGDQFAKLFKAAVVCLCFAGTVFLLYVILRESSSYGTGVFYKSFRFGLDTFRVHVLLTIVICATFFYSVYKNFALSRAYEFLIYAVFLTPAAYFFLVYFNFINLSDRHIISIFTTYFARTTTIPFTIGLATVTSLFYLSGRSSGWFDEHWGMKAVNLCLIASVVAVAYDYRLTAQWNENYLFFKQTLSKQSTCVELEPEYFKNRKYFESSVPPYAVHAMSILVQVIDEKLPVSKVMFLTSRDWAEKGYQSACRSQNDKLVSYYGNVVELKKNIPFSNDFLVRLGQ